LMVFNRWGQEVYVSPTPYKNDWDGKGKTGDQLVEGVYYLVFKFEGNTVSQNIYIKP
jgi:hypothetical protein